MLTDSKIFEMALAHGACWPDEDECELSRAQLVAFSRGIEAAAYAQCEACGAEDCIESIRAEGDWP